VLVETIYILPNLARFFETQDIVPSHNAFISGDIFVLQVFVLFVRMEIIIIIIIVLVVACSVLNLMSISIVHSIWSIGQQPDAGASADFITQTAGY